MHFERPAATMSGAKKLTSDGGGVSKIIGRSEAALRLKSLIARIAESASSTVLITGETGTGKDLAARCIHECSSRRDGPFLNVTCVAVPSQLLESELFGHERGAFTDAGETRLGLFEQADGGTIFLDEAGDMDLSAQSKLLRFLESHHFRRVGGSAERTSNVRIVAATNVNLMAAIKNRSFREDLYYRLAVLVLHVVPLRERKEDIEALFSFFVGQFTSAAEQPELVVSRDALCALQSHDWPGNVRELRNVAERAVLSARGGTVGAEDIEIIRAPPAEHDLLSLPEAGIDLEALERNLVTQALARCSGNRTRAAALLCMTRDQMRYRLEKYALQAASR